MVTSDSNFPHAVGFPRLAVATARKTERKLSIEQRQALADLASIARGVSYDIDHSRPIDRAYLLGVGKQLVEVAAFFSNLSARDWDDVIRGIS